MNPFDDNPYNPVDSFVLTALPPSAPFSSARKTAVDGSARLYVTENHRVVVYGSSVMPPDTDGDGLYDFRDQCDFEAPAMGLDADVFLYVQSGTPVKMFYGPGAGCTDTIPLLQSVLDALDENGMDGSFVTIDSNIYRGLSGKLGDAQKALDRRNTAAAVNKLVDFRTQVENWFWYDLYPNINHYLVTYANNLIELIGE